MGPYCVILNRNRNLISESLITLQCFVKIADEEGNREKWITMFSLHCDGLISCAIAIAYYGGKEKLFLKHNSSMKVFQIFFSPEISIGTGVLVARIRTEKQQ